MKEDRPLNELERAVWAAAFVASTMASEQPTNLAAWRENGRKAVERADNAVALLREVGE